MRFLPLLLANLGRRKTRTFLTVGSFAVALFLYGLLVTIEGAFSQGIEVAGADRLVVINRVSLIQPLPLRHRDKLLQVPGVKDVTYSSWFGGVYQDERNFFVQFAIDDESFRRMYPEFLVPEADWQAYLADRQGCVAGETLAQRFGWKLGDRIPIRGTIHPGTWEFNLRAIYRGSREQDDTTQFWFHHEYLEENGADWAEGLVGWYVVRVADPERAPQVLQAIDATFANSNAETRTDTEKNFAAAFVKQMGNIKALVLAVGGVVFFTLLLVSGSTMAMAVRERTGELAVLKSIGYSDRFVLGLVLVEATLIAGLGGAIGLLGAKAFTLGGDPTGGLLPLFLFPASGIVAGAALTLLVGLLAGVLPALSAMRLRVVDALRRV